MSVASSAERVVSRVMARVSPILESVDEGINVVADGTTTTGNILPSFIAHLPGHPDLSHALTMPRGAARKQWVYDTLVKATEEAQKPFIARAEELKKSGDILAYHPMTAPNAIVITPRPGHANEVMDIFRKDGVLDLYSSTQIHKIHPSTKWDAEHGVHLLPPQPRLTPDEAHGGTASEPTGIPWDVEMMRAPEAWKLGADGHDLVFGSIDSGTDGTHRDLINAYRGLQPDGTIDHNYSWADYLGKSDHPVDYASHGTHVMGGAVGDLGVAPKAKWISVAASSPTDGTDMPLMRAMQWMLAPTNLEGRLPRPDMAPDVLGISWTIGKGAERLLGEVMDNFYYSGIEVVKSAGNKGVRRSITPPGEFPLVHTITSIDQDKRIGLGASRGPSRLKGPDGKRFPKPDYAAPGVRILSTVPGVNGGFWDIRSGSSMAQPKGSGAVLDIMSVYPQLTTEQLHEVIGATAENLGLKGYDYRYGHGLINIEAAVKRAEEVVAEAKPTALTDEHKGKLALNIVRDARN